MKLNKKTYYYFLFFLNLCSFKTKGQQPVIISDLEDEYYIYKKDTKYGIGKDSTKTLYRYDTIVQSKMEELIFTRIKGLWGVLNKNQKVLIPNIYDRITLESGNDKQNFIVKKNDRYGTVNNKNKIIIPIKFDAITNWIENGPKAHYVVIENIMGLIGHNGKMITPIEYDSIYYYNDRIIKVKFNGKCGIINSKNKTILPLIYDALIVDFNTYKLLPETHKDKFVPLTAVLRYAGSLVHWQI
jgi:hypothetical protein